MATLNDVLKDVLEKDFDKEDVEKVVNPRDDEPTGTDREAQEGDTENEDVGQTYNDPGDYAQNTQITGKSVSDCNYAYYKLSLGFADSKFALYCTDPCKAEGHSCGR